jgi:Gamma-glutamyl cyclotransferase, AIG2-like
MRRVRVFFYGLFMDDDLLRAKGLDPQDAELACVDDLALQIGERAALIDAPGGRVHGRVFSLTCDDLERLYSEPSVQAYRPEAVLARLASGASIAALCYNLPEPLQPDGRSPKYVTELRELARRIGLPPDYIASIR